MDGYFSFGLCSLLVSSQNSAVSTYTFFSLVLTPRSPLLLYLLLYLLNLSFLSLSSKSSPAPAAYVSNYKSKD
jgi:hypothetical protein